MTVYEIETMRALQRKYYGEFRHKRYRSLEVFVYRLWIVFSLGFIVACFIDKF